MKDEVLQRMLKAQNGVFSVAQFKLAGGSASSVQRAVRRGELERVTRGVYQLPALMDDDMFSAQLHRGQMIYSHDTALYLHGLSDRDPLKYSVTVPTGYNTKRLISEGFRVFSLKKGLHGQDVEEVMTGHGRLVKAYNVERTICDCLRSRNRLQSDVVLSGLKGYVRLRNRDLTKLMKTAEKLSVSKLLRTYLEVLL